LDAAAAIGDESWRCFQGVQLVGQRFEAFVFVAPRAPMAVQWVYVTPQGSDLSNILPFRLPAQIGWRRIRRKVAIACPVLAPDPRLGLA
jgi:hypothetical protein